MGCKTITTQSSEIFSLDKMYDEDYTLQQINNKFKQLSKEWKTLNKDDIKLLEEIHDYLEENYYKCYICDDYFEDHEFNFFPSKISHSSTSRRFKLPKLKRFL